MRKRNPHGLRMFQRFADEVILTAFSLLYAVAVGVLRWPAKQADSQSAAD